MELKKKIKQWISGWKRDVIVFFIAVVIGTWISWTIFGEISKSTGIGLVIGLLCVVLVQQITFQRTIPNTIDKTFDKRMSQIIEFVALGTQNGYFEEHLAKLKEQALGTLKWAVAKFISYKLNKDFNAVGKIEIHDVSAKEYSKLLAELIKECSESTYVTCPYTPTEWFVELGVRPCKDTCSNGIPVDSCDGPEGILFEDAKHMEAFCKSAVSDKRRVVNLPINKFNSLKQDPCFKNFLNYKTNRESHKNLENDYKIKIRFVSQEDLESSLGDLRNDDYNVLDKKVVMKWIVKKDNNDKKLDLGTCILIFDKGEIEKHLKIFESIDSSIYKKSAKITGGEG